MKPLLSYSLLLTLVAFCSLSVSEVEAQACTFPTFGDVSFVIDDALDNIAGTNTTSVLFDYALSCISVAREANRFRLATAVINFTTNSTVLRSIGCQRNTFCLTFLEMSCNERTNMWERNQIFVTQSFTKDGNESLNVSLRMDCGNCGIERSIPKEAKPIFDPKTHCFRKSTEGKRDKNLINILAILISKIHHSIINLKCLIGIIILHDSSLLLLL